MNWAAVGDFLRRRRVEKGMTLRDLASNVGMPSADLSALETGAPDAASKISLRHLHHLAQRLDVSVDYLMVHDGPASYEQMAGRAERKGQEANRAPITVHVCRGRGTRQSCQTPGCHRDSVALCDYPVTRNGVKGTCDRRMCSGCRHPQTGKKDTDYCGPHHQVAQPPKETTPR